jgi:hypothetical protein
VAFKLIIMPFFLRVDSYLGFSGSLVRGLSEIAIQWRLKWNVVFL